jgi:hypothetical protein
MSAQRCSGGRRVPLFFGVLLVTVSMATAAPAGYAGRPLAEVLLSLQGQGLIIVFTDRLVRPDMVVAREPVARAPRQLLEEILAPFGLAVQAGPEGVLVVVAKAAGPGQGAAGRTAEGRRPPAFHDEIVVQPSRLSLLGERSDPSLSLGREEIESLPHLGGDVLRTTSLLPGVAASDVTAQPSVHGGRRDEVQVLLDGQELYDAYHLKDYDNALSFVPARALASASLTTGAYPASHGDRMSAVLELRTTDPPAGRQIVLGLSVLDALASSSGRFAADRGAWLLTARRGSLDLARAVIGNENPQFWDVLGKTEIATGFGLLGARVLAAGDQLELDRTEHESVERFENSYHTSYGWLTHQAMPGRRLLVETIASWARIERRRGGTGSDEEGDFMLRDQRDHRVLGLAETWSLQLTPEHVLKGGLEARRYDASFDYAKRMEPDLVILAPFAPPRLTEHRFEGSLRGDHLGLWASDLVSWSDRWTAELGLRSDRHTATGDDLLSPRINLAWRPGEHSVVRTAWGRFYQSQRPYELQVEDGESALRRAELSEHWVLGFETALRPNRPGFAALRLELFHRAVEEPRPRYESLLEPLNFFPEIEPDRVRIAPERSTAAGLELLLRGRRGERYDWWLAYSWARAEDRLAGAWVPRPLDQPQTLALDLNVRLPKAWNLNLAWRAHTGWPTTPVTARRVTDPDDPEEPRFAAVFGPLNSERFPPYHRLDLRASRRWELRAGRMTFFVDVQNLYDRRNLAGYSVQLDEDTGALSLEKQYWAGIFPSLGIAWEL